MFSHGRVQTCGAGGNSGFRRRIWSDPRPVLRWIDRGRTRRTVHLIVVIWLLALSDLFFTIWAHLFTPFKELNPLARSLLAEHRIGTLSCGKIALTALGTAIFWCLRKYTRAEIALWAVMIVYVALMVRWSDYTSQVLTLGIVMP
jgi:hypothetical protein